MTWAVKLFKKIYLQREEQDFKVLKVDDLVLAVLDKQKEIEDSADFFKTKEYIFSQARAFRELVSKCQLLKTTKKIKISSESECLTCSGTNAVMGKEGYEDCPDCKEMKQ